MNVVDLLLKLLSFESLTPDDAGSLKFIEEYLDEYEAMYVNKEGVKNLMLSKKFAEGPHLCFAGHVDVVPAGDGWETNPFVPVIKEGNIYARGTQDMKSGVAAFVQTCKEIEHFEGTLSVLLTSDEEGDAKYGTVVMLEHLKEIGFLPDYCIVAVPTCETTFGDAIKIAGVELYRGDLELTQGSSPFVTKRDSKIVKQLSSSIKNVTGVETKLSTTGGTSDARFMGAFGIDVVEFGVINDTIHAPNERTSIKEVEALCAVFKDTVKHFN